MMTLQRKSKPRTNEKRSQGETLKLTIELLRAKLKKKAAALGVKGLNLSIPRKIKVPPEFRVPSNSEFGQANPLNVDIVRKIDFYDLKTGLRCEGCYSPCAYFDRLKRYNNFFKTGCISCRRGNYRRYTTSYGTKIPAMKRQKREFTKQPLNHVAYVGRSSRGQSICHDSFKNLQNFAKKWELFPHAQTHKINNVDCFGAHGSGLANYTAMTSRCSKGKKDGYSPESISDIVNRIQQVYSARDVVTIVVYQISGITVKISNLISLINYFKQAGMEKINFVFFGKQSFDRKTMYDPYIMSSEKIEEFFKGRTENDFIFKMKIGAFARIFSLESGRNKGAIWMNYETIKHLLPDIDMEIEDEVDVDD